MHRDIDRKNVEKAWVGLGHKLFMYYLPGSQRVINEAESDVLASIVCPAGQEVMVTFVSTAKRFRSTSGPSRARAASESLKQ